MGVFDKIKKKIGGRSEEYPDEFSEDYVEIDSSAEANKPKAKVIVRPFVLEDFAGVKEVIEALRDGYTIALVNIRPLREKDLVELKRAVTKLKKTTDAMEGDIAGLSDDYLVITPSFAEIYRNKEMSEVNT